MDNAVTPLSVTTFTSAPCSIRNTTTSRWPPPTAYMSGVQPVRLFSLTLTPCPRTTLAMAVSRQPNANELSFLISAPCSRRVPTVSALSFSRPNDSAVPPYLFLARRSLPFSKRSLTAAARPSITQASGACGRSRPWPQCPHPWRAALECDPPGRLARRRSIRHPCRQRQQLLYQLVAPER